MEDCCGFTRKCKRIALEDEASSAAAGLFKRTRTCDPRESQLSPTNYELQSRHFAVNFPEWSCGFSSVDDSSLIIYSDHHSLASSRSLSSTESCEVVNERSSKSLDLEAKSSETENETETESSTCINSKLSSGETTPVSDRYGGGDGMESQPEKQPTSHRKRPPAASAARKPSNDEIEDFFSASEKYEQQRFAEKYNFDIVKDVPLEGRYQWVKLKP